MTKVNTAHVGILLPEPPSQVLMMDDDDPLLSARSVRQSNARNLRTPAGAIVEIVDSGDLILQIADRGCRSTHSFRVSTTSLGHASAYFENLLDPRKFNEGATVSARLTVLHQRYANISQVPATDLPIIRIEDVGQFPKGECCQTIMERFLDILHVTRPSLTNTLVPITHDIALLAVVADRFSSLSPVSSYVDREGWLKPRQAAKEIKRNNPTGDIESFCRQKVLIGTLLDNGLSVLIFSARLINEGSRRWTQRNNTEGDEDEALWWNLPSGLEGERSAQWEQ